MELVQHKHQNVHSAERWASVIAGSSLAYYGIRQSLKYHSLPGASLALAGAALIRRGMTGYCDVYRMMGVNTAPPQPGAHAVIPYREGIRIDRSITINATREDVYAFWRNLENLPRFMKHVRSVKMLDALHSRWTIEAPAGQKVEWEAEIINEIPNELLAWRSMPGASVDNAGSVRFEHATAGRGTKVLVSLQYNPPAGPISVFFAKLMGQDPETQIDVELQRLKNIIEAGEIPTTQSQPTGRTEDQAAQRTERVAKQEEVHHASEDSFPASDPPSYSHVNGR